MKVTFDQATNTLTVPKVAGVVYTIDGEPVSGQIVIDKETTVLAEPAKGSFFADDAIISDTFSPTSTDNEENDTI